MIKLTDYQSGLEVYIKPDIVVCIRGMVVTDTLSGGFPIKTHVHTNIQGDYVTVRQTPAQVLAAIKSSKGAP